MARNGRNTVIYKGTFVSNQSLGCKVDQMLYSMDPRDMSFPSCYATFTHLEGKTQLDQKHYEIVFKS